MIYLASAQAPLDCMFYAQRYQEACRAVAHLTTHDCVVFSPVMHHQPLMRYGLPNERTYWKWIDRAYLRDCDEVVVLTSIGWRFCWPLMSDIAFARELCKPIGYLSPNDVTAPTLAHQPQEVEL